MDPYQLLGIRPSASLDEAEAAYRQLLRVHHPDLHQHGSPDELAAAEAWTRALNAAIGRIRADRPPAPTSTPGQPTPGSSWIHDDPHDAAGGAYRGSGPSSATANATHRTHAGTRSPWSAPGTAGTRTDPGAGSGWVWGPEPPHDCFTGSTRDFTARAGGTGGKYFGEPLVPVPCPICGLGFQRSSVLKLHAIEAHGISLEPRRPTRTRRRRFRRWSGRRGRTSIWLFIPVNALAAMLAAQITATVLDPAVGYWTFVVAMAPTAMRLVGSRPHDQ